MLGVRAEPCLGERAVKWLWVRAAVLREASVKVFGRGQVQAGLWIPYSRFESPAQHLRRASMSTTEAVTATQTAAGGGDRAISSRRRGRGVAASPTARSRAGQRERPRRMSSHPPLPAVNDTLMELFMIDAQARVAIASRVLPTTLRARPQGAARVRSRPSSSRLSRRGWIACSPGLHAARSGLLNIPSTPVAARRDDRLSEEEDSAPSSSRPTPARGGARAIASAQRELASSTSARQAGAAVP